MYILNNKRKGLVNIFLSYLQLKYQKYFSPKNKDDCVLPFSHAKKLLHISLKVESRRFEFFFFVSLLWGPRRIQINKRNVITA